MAGGCFLCIFLFISMDVSDLIGNSLAGVLSAGSAIFVWFFGMKYCILAPMIILHSFSSWYCRKTRTLLVQKVFSVSKLVFSICTVAGFFVVSNTVFLLLPGSSMAESIPSNIVYALYIYLFLYFGYIAYILHGYLNPALAEDEESSDVIRHNQLKTLTSV
ncbi:hypothetical protein NEMIN01_0882 [Nematocida minor]|uniref:uncharacterized protein n=1 Tax=Nematocida minor TaxID=1912983 RepID=UPI0022212947|nr:uncharacterized protein NEMIN01_0882 [Nematocida minor]KAI5190097.1 hypothetical protein NEMIN01_0882 [Nematocida minor]